MTKRIIGAGGGGGGCFTAETLVAVPGGQARIDEIVVGSSVLSFDDKGEIHSAKVLKVHKHENERVVRYALWGGEFLDATPNHWVLNQYNAFVEIGTLEADDCVVDSLNQLRPILHRDELGNHTVYNLTVEGRHTFIANGVRVHNAGLGSRIIGAGGGGGGGGKGGGGGGGGTSRTPTEADDSLQSVQFASVLDLLSEGEIDGIEDGNKGIFLDGTPVESSGGSNNFTGFSVTTRNGTQAQSYISAVGGTQSEKSVGVEILKSTAVTRTITDTDVDRVRITVSVPSLQKIEDDGDIVGNSVTYRIQIQYNGGGFTAVGSDKTISGKSSDQYLRDHIITLTGAFPVDIRLVRITDDNQTSKNQNRTFWSSFTEIIDEKLRYPNSALCHLRFDSRQFSNIPARKYLIRGIKVRIPSNATVDTTTHLGRLTYSGVWDGTFSAATWTNDPAWCLFDLLTDTRYGCSVPESSLDRYDFFSISQYCNELVPDGRSGQEVRFACNMLLNSRDEVFNVISEMTSIFRGISYYGAGSLVLSQDKPADSQYVIGPSNVVDGLFTYSGSSQKSRHTCATVAYQNYDDLGEVSFEYVEDDDAVSKYGVINKDIRAVGCYSQGQANRLGKWTLLSEQNLTETCTFSIGIESGIVVRPGMVIDVADPVRGGTRRLGRVKSATTTEVTIDSTTDFSVDTDQSPTISVVLPTGLVETKEIESIDAAVITVSGGFSQAPAANANWLIQTTDIQSQQFRVVSIAEGDDGTFGVTAIRYNETIYDAVEEDLNLTQRDITNLSSTPDPVSNVSVTEFLYEDDGIVRTGVDLSWSGDRRRVSEYRVKYRLDNNNFEEIITSSTSPQIKGLKTGTLEVQVIAYNYIGRQSTIVKNSFELVGKTAVPGNVQNLTLEAISTNSARLKWDEAVDLDVKVGGKVHIRHSSKTDGSATFSNSVDLITAIAGNSTEANVSLLEGEYIVKFADDGGRLSPNDVSVIVEQPDAFGDLLVKNHREDQQTPLPFQGTHEDTFYSSEFDALTLDGSQLIDDEGDIDDIASIDFLGDIKPLGTYTLLDTIDMGLALNAVELERRFVTRAFLPRDLMDGRTANIDDWDDIDGDDVNNVNAELYVRTTNDDPSGSPTYGSWNSFNNGTLKGRAFQFKVELTSDKVDENILVDELGYKMKLKSRTESSDAEIASGTSTKSVTFEKPFFTGTSALGGVNAHLPSVGITVQNLGANERFNISNVSSTGFDIDVLDASDNNVNRNFTYSANGYGRGQ
jgi:predicted phage tail protein